jgi:diguanylate cyclase (GGDEF)-like protein
MCVTLHAAGILPFGVTSEVYLLICVFIMLSVLYKAYKSKTFRNHSKMLVTAFYFFIACVVLNVLWYIFTSPIEPSLTFSKFGLMAYIVAVLYNSIEGFISNMLRAQEGNKIFDIAYTDNLTRVGNRYAFDRDINTLNLNYVCLVSCDVNNLKYYNDTFGHAQGDELLKKSVELLQSVYGQSVYRTGGDEFIVLLAMSSDEELKYKYDCLSKAMKKHNDKNGATLLVEIATGYSKYQEGDESYEDILRRADKNMYRDKKALKSVSPIKYER